jgi:hypothetical protein
VKIGELLSRVPSAQDLFLNLAAGQDAQGIYNLAARGRAAVPYTQARPDRSAHAMGAELMAQRLGGDATRTIGVGKEVVQGLAQLLQGGAFAGEHGFDPGDVEANELGIRASGSPGMGARLIDLLARGR